MDRHTTNKWTGGERNYRAIAAEVPALTREVKDTIISIYVLLFYKDSSQILCIYEY